MFYIQVSVYLGCSWRNVMSIPMFHSPADRVPRSPSGEPGARHWRAHEEEGCSAELSQLAALKLG